MPFIPGLSETVHGSTMLRLLVRSVACPTRRLDSTMPPSKIELTGGEDNYTARPIEEKDEC
jgi:hypothetical protein